MLKNTLICILFALVVSGCSKSAGSIAPTALPTSASPIPQAFPSLPAIVTPTISVIPTPFTPFTVNPAVDNLNIRVNPGMLFEVLMMVQPADVLTVLGSAPGGEWTYVQTATGAEGWVHTELLQSNFDLAQTPVRDPKNVLLIKGRVIDASGIPIQGVGFDVSQGAAGEASTNSIVTDASGLFYSFLPITASGAWTVSYTSIACKSNVWSDIVCASYKTGYTGNVDPLTQTVNLPQSGDPLFFTWR